MFQGKTVAERLEELKNDPEYSHLQGEIAELRLAKEAYLEENQERLADAKMHRPLLHLDEQIRKLVDTAHKIEYDEANVVTVGTVMAFAARIGVILREEIADQALLDLVSQRIAALFYARARGTALVIADEVALDRRLSPP